MKTILQKTSLLLMFFMLTSYCTYSQIETNTLGPFLGNWEWVNGNETFKLNFFIENEGISGNYKLVEINNGQDLHGTQGRTLQPGKLGTGWSRGQ